MSTPVPEENAPLDAEPEQRNWWIWISVALAIVAAALLVWALSLKSDKNSAQSELDKTKQQLASTQEELDNAKQPEATPTPEGDDGNPVAVAGALAGIKALFDDLADELGATQEDLAQTQKDLDEANQRAEQAEQEAADAKKKAENAGNETEKAQAQAEQAQAEQKATQSKADAAKECTRAFVSAFSTVLDAEDPAAEADDLKQQLTSIAADCKTALEDT